MTDFQKLCIEECDKLFLSKGYNVTFEKIIGKKETYYIGYLRLSNEFEIYIYDDEAGLGINKTEWMHCERPDYESDEELIAGFINILDKQVK